LNELSGPDLAWLMWQRAAFMDGVLSTCVGDAIAVALRGDVDISNTGDITAALGSLAAGGGYLVVDMSALEFIDCAALGELLRVRLVAAAAGGDVVLAGLHGYAARILELTNLGDEFRVYGSVQDAAAREACAADRHLAQAAARAAPAGRLAYVHADRG
jgi:anti-sigma B factor antagonist